MLDRTPEPLRAILPDQVPVEAVLVGRTVEDAAALLPRMFSLCRAAQGAAARLALGLSAQEDHAALAREARRDHLLKLCVTWPGYFGCAPSPLPADWAEGGRAVALAVFGPAGAMPATLADFRAWIAAGTGISATLRLIDGCFGPGEATGGDLPLVDDATAFLPGPVENSVASRVAGHPLLRELAQSGGRSPLWRAVARAVDLERTLRGATAEPRLTAPGRALVPAARGLFALSARVVTGRVASLSRVTPTDHLTARGGALDRCLAALPSDRAALAPLLIDILDPCIPIRLTGGQDA